MPPCVVAPYRVPLTAIKPPYGTAASGAPRNEYNTFFFPDVVMLKTVPCPAFPPPVVVP